MLNTLCESRSNNIKIPTSEKMRGVFTFQPGQCENAQQWKTAIFKNSTVRIHNAVSDKHGFEVMASQKNRGLSYIKQLKIKAK